MCDRNLADEKYGRLLGHGVQGYDSRQDQSATARRANQALFVRSNRNNEKLHTELRSSWISVSGTTTNIMIDILAPEITSSSTIWNEWNDHYVPTGGTTTWNRWNYDSANSTTSGASRATWKLWNNYTTSTVTWEGWNRGVVVRRESFESRESREIVEHQRAAIRLRQVEAEKAREEALKKAEALLREYLSEEQIEELEKTGGFVVLGSSGKPYTIKRGYQGNVQNGRFRYCAHGPSNIPVPDQMLMQKLALETDEEAFLAVANRSVALL